MRSQAHVQKNDVEQVGTLADLHDLRDTCKHDQLDKQDDVVDALEPSFVLNRAPHESGKAIRERAN